MQINRLSASLGVSLLCACAPTRVVTTPAPTPPAGAQIRYALRSDSSKFVRGRLFSLDADTLVVERLISGPNQDQWVPGSVASDSIARLQVLVGHRRNGGRGALIGALVGGMFGALCAANAEDLWSTPEQCLAGFTLMGAGTGFLFGSIAKSDVWAPTAVPSHPPAPAPVAARPINMGIRLPISILP